MRTSVPPNKHQCFLLPRQARIGVHVRVCKVLITFLASSSTTVRVPCEIVEKSVSRNKNLSAGKPFAFVDTTRLTPSPLLANDVSSAHRLGSSLDETTDDPTSSQESTSSLDFSFTATSPPFDAGSLQKRNFLAHNRFERSVSSHATIRADPVTGFLNCYKDCTDKPSSLGPPPLTAIVATTEEVMS